MIVLNVILVPGVYFMFVSRLVVIVSSFVRLKRPLYIVLGLSCAALLIS